jgi:NADPH-dependent 2,4-dienoyl-CoA reductase/sulfur reductase-like enzyme/nitrite reductase/ring-hydroxylating ferredoxin subunit
MAAVKVLSLAELPAGSKKAVSVGDTEILLVHLPAPTATAASRTQATGQASTGQPEPTILAVEAKCPHAGAPLEQGALCDGKLICPWHTATYTLPTGTWLEPPTLRSLKTYPVRLENDSIYVDPEPRTSPTLARDFDTPPTPRTSDPRHFVLIGAGAASATAVCTLRQKGFSGRITLLDPVSSEPVDRTNLSKMALSGQKPLDTLPLWTEEDRAALNIEHVHEEATAIDPAGHTITLGNGGSLFFDAALVATGGAPATLGIPGEDLPHVFTLRHLPDLEAILKRVQQVQQASQGKNAAILGDSFIALEAAAALTTRGLSVTVIARDKVPFAKKWDDAPAEALLALHRSKGVTLKTEAEAQSISATAVTLKDGTSVPADLVLVAIGVKPLTGFASALALNDAGMAKIGKDLQAAPSVWAAGDITEVNGVHIEHWRVAQQQGRAAALNMLSIESTPGVPFFWTSHFGKRLGYAGHAEEWDELVIDGDLDSLDFLAYYLRDGTVAAVLGCGQDSALAMLEGKLHQPLTLSEARAAAASAS